MRPYRVPRFSFLRALGLLVVLAGLAGCTPAAPATPTNAPAAAPAPTAAAKPASPVAASSPAPSPSAAVAVASPSPGLSLSPSPAASPSASPAAGNPAAPRPANASLKISAPSAGQSVPAGSIQVTVEYSGPPLVAAASATKLDDYHLHYFLDESATPYLGTTTPVPMGNPHIVHTAATQVSFDGVTAGTHTVVVMLSGANHVSVVPPLSDQVTFTVS